MTTVVDASAVVAAALEEDNLVVIAAVETILAAGNVVAPRLLPTEVAGAIAMAGWMKRRSPESCTDAWQWSRRFFRLIALRLDDDDDKLFDICRMYQLRGADASYLQLALRERASLLTGDKALARAALAAGVPLVHDPNT
jgi:predicted nucleic acid-binding protein